MMKTNAVLSCFIVFIFGSQFIGFVQSTTWVEDASDIRHPGKCVKEGIILSTTEEYDPKDQCIKLICGEGSAMTGFDCGSRTMKNCEDLGYADVSKPYPDCCVKKFKCLRNEKEELVEF